jgi:hypothetical protein
MKSMNKSSALLTLLLLGLILILLSGCTPAGKTDSGTTTQNQQTTTTSSENRYERDVYTTDDKIDLPFYKVTPDALIQVINDKITKAGYAPFVQVDTYISTFDSADDSYYYKMEGKTGQFSINTIHKVGMVDVVYLTINDAETPAALNQFLMETLADVFAPGKGKEICQQLDIYSVKPTDQYSYRMVTVGNSDFGLSVPDEFSVRPVSD